MYINNFNWYLTKHGRKRYIERIGLDNDSSMISTAVNGKVGFLFRWVPDKKYPTTARRLVTVLYTLKKE